MKTLCRLVLALCVGFAVAQPASAQEANDPVATATAVLDRMDAGEYEAATLDFNAQMKAALGAGRLRDVQRQLEAAGPVVSRGEPQVARQDGLDVVAFRVQREHAAFNAVVAVDGDGKVAGLHFTPAPGAAR